MEDQAEARWVGKVAGAPWSKSTQAVAPRWIGTLVVEPQKWTGTTVGAQWDSAKLQLPAQRGPAGVNF